MTANRLRIVNKAINVKDLNDSIATFKVVYRISMDKQ